MSSEDWKSRADQKKAALADRIPHEWRIKHIPSLQQRLNVVDWPLPLLSAAELLITNSPATVILANVHARVWSAEEVTLAFCYRAAIAHQLVNCLTEILFDEAIAQARDLDRYQAQTGLKGPLHGLPMSFIDQFRVGTAETAAGLVSCLGLKETNDSESLLVQHMKSLGAIPFCKTNVPQSMLLGTTANNVIGSTFNPFNRALSAGGAAGGEGALLAMRGSPFGWAIEMSGSARIPAVLNGLYALRVSTGRLPTLGLALTTASLPVNRATVAMMSSDLESLFHVSRIALGSDYYQLDPEWIDMPWRESKLRVTQNQRPVFAVFRNDRYVQPQPPVRRALDIVVNALRNRGLKVLELVPPPHRQAVQNLFKIIGADGATELRTELMKSGEPPVEQLRDWFSDESSTSQSSIFDFWSLCKSRLDYMTAYRTYWDQTGAMTSSERPVDGFIMPVVADAACYENKLTYFSYSAIVNYLDNTAISFPVTHVDKTIDTKPASPLIFNAEDGEIQAAYEPETFHGCPVGLQLMCRRHQEEVALGLVDIIMQALRD